MKSINKYIALVKTSMLIFLMTGCLEKYEAPSSSNRINYLVVDGFLNTSNNSAIVKLSRTVGLSIGEALPPESNATVSIESEQGSSYPLSETTEAGTYSSTILNANPANKYRLHISTSDGKEYLSKYVVLKSSPSLDSVTWQPTSEGVKILVNAHDNTNQTHYYKWVYTETWHYTSTYQSYFKMVSGVPTLRNIDEFIYNCWKVAHEDQLLITSTLRLKSDVVSQFPIAFIPKGSVKVSLGYSILVEQRALDEDAFNYWQLLEKTTENLGGLFDPLPSQVTGNIYNTNDSSEPVLGYFSGGGVEQKRMSINHLELPTYLQTYTTGLNCEMQSIPLDKLSDIGASVLISSYGQPVLLGYTASSAVCVDCRFMGGNNVKPDFWPY